MKYTNSLHPIRSMRQKFYILFCIIVLSISGISAEVIENGFVKEYRGKDTKNPLPGVELMIVGAQSTVSDVNGKFCLRFATMKPGEKINYTEIYKEGYVIFNKDALDAWRISNNGKPFTLVMCRESEFRRLKKKFYGIIEKSYYDEFLKQKEQVDRLYRESMQYQTKIQEIEREYETKMSNINAYVELFSRIDLNEMDSVEMQALNFMETGMIEDAIRTYEELQLSRQMNRQMSKWDAAEEMHRAAQGMESDAQADLIMLVGKFQKQISLYRMGGRDYNGKRYDMIDDLILLLERLLPVTGNQYKELLGEMIIERTQGKHPANKLTDIKRAAELPSAIGLRELAREYEFKRPTEEVVDSIRLFYNQALSLIDRQDSLALHINEDLRHIPHGFFHTESGLSLPYRIENNEAVLTSAGPYYSAHIEGEVILPDEIKTEDGIFPVTRIAKSAFKYNKHVKNIRLPRHCHIIETGAFQKCDSLTEIAVNSELDSLESDNYSIPLNIRLSFSESPRSIRWIQQRIYLSQNDSTADIAPLYLEMARYNKGDPETAYNYYQNAVDNRLKSGDIDGAKYYAVIAKEQDKLWASQLMVICYCFEGNYKEAINLAKKGIYADKAASFNYLAYLYADPYNTERNFNLAHQAIDKAIAHSKNSFEKACYIDSKGEIYLMDNQEDKAREYLELAISTCPDYISRTNSALYSHFHPERSQVQTNSQERITRQQRRNLAVALMTWETIREQIETIEYNNELVNANHIAEVLKSHILHNIYSIEPGNPEMFYQPLTQLTYTILVEGIGQNLWQFCQAHNMSFNNEWIKLIDADNVNNLESLHKRKLHQLVILYQLGKLNTVGELTVEDIRDLRHFNFILEHFLPTITEARQSVLLTLLEGSDIPYLYTRYPEFSITDIYRLIDEFYEYMDTHDAGIDFVDIPDNYSTDESGFPRQIDEYITQIRNQQSDDNSNRDTTKLKEYLNLVNLCAEIEFDFLKNQSENFLSPDYEELVSIGILAVQVLIKDKTPEQLAKYNVAYIITAVRWAIRNELSIRYKWYSLLTLKTGTSDTGYYDEMKEYDKRGIDYQKAMVRLAVYESIAKVMRLAIMYNLNGEDIPDLFRMWNGIKNARENLTGTDLECFDALFTDCVNARTLTDRFTPFTIHNMLNNIKQELNANNIYGY